MVLIPPNLPGYTLHEELEELVKAGLTPYEALRVSTTNAHEFLGELETAGTIEPGKNANLVLLNANPLEDISNTRTIEGVIFKTDMSGNFKYLNKAWEDLSGMPISDALNKNYRDLLTGINDQERIRINKFLSENSRDYATLFKFFKPTGEKIWVQLRLVAKVLATKDTGLSTVRYRWSSRIPMALCIHGILWTKP